ncbi:MAG TPA: hypothetical protein VD738_03670 [Nitrospira sp.]|nr:hypothetical protein [Nitrospira sp.]
MPDLPNADSHSCQGELQKIVHLLAKSNNEFRPDNLDLPIKYPPVQGHVRVGRPNLASTLDDVGQMAVLYPILFENIIEETITGARKGSSGRALRDEHYRADAHKALNFALCWEEPGVWDRGENFLAERLKLVHSIIHAFRREA